MIITSNQEQLYAITFSMIHLYGTVLSDWSHHVMQIYIGSGLAIFSRFFQRLENFFEKNETTVLCRIIFPIDWYQLKLRPLPKFQRLPHVVHLILIRLYTTLFSLCQCTILLGPKTHYAI
jgi:hypothetical protein